MLTDLSGLNYRERMTVRDDDPGGWDTYSPPEGADGLHLRWGRDDAGRWVITDLYLHGKALTAGVLRAISLPRMEAQRNSEAEILASPGSQVFRRERYWPPGDEGLTTAELRRRAAEGAKLHAASSAGTPPPRGKISRPDRSDPGSLEQFYRLVAMAYKQYAQDRPPAPAIAEEAGVPVTTVHRWVREARRRGFLPPGVRGRVG
jgi:hypothetical protein